MASIIWEDVAGVAPELGGTRMSLIAQDMILQLANTYLAVDNWGGEASPKLKMARAYVAAHFATMQLRRGIPGAVASSAAGGLSRSYATPMLNMNTTMQLTGYGMLYIQLAKTTAARAGFGLGMVSPTAGVPVDPGWDG